MELLVQMGAEKDAKDANGRTPLHWAAAMGHVEAMQLLVQLRTLGVRFGGSLALRALALS
jgi:ankyrin repeat protein